MPTRLTRSILPPFWTLLIAAHTTAYRSPGLAVDGMATVTVSTAGAPVGTSRVDRLTVVQVDRSLAVCAAAPTKEPWVMAAAAGYTATCCADVVVLDTTMRRWMVVPGAR